MASVRIEPVTSQTDISTCARLCCDAFAGDPFSDYLERYSEASFYDQTVARLSAAADSGNTTDFAFKAVLDVTDERGAKREVIVGVSYWYYGYVVVPKVDPFRKVVMEQGNEITPDEVATGDTESLPNARQRSRNISKNAAAAMAEVERLHGNMYVGTIRGKKHIYLRRMMVDPQYQKRGIGRKLLQWGLDVADRERIVAYLNARPVATKMYMDAGFEVVGYIHVPVPDGDADLDVPPGASMLRQPRPQPQPSSGP